MDRTYLIPKTKSVIRTDHVQKYVSKKNILHIGVGGAIIDYDLKRKFLGSDISNWFHSRISAVANSVTTLELEQDNIDKFKKIIPGIYIKGDITDPNITDQFSERYELIVFTEILEHIDCFRSALQNMRRLLQPGGQVIITTPNAYNIYSFLKMMFRYEANHKEHTAYFSYLTIKRLLEMNGFQICEFNFCYDNPKSVYKRSIKYVQNILFPQYSQGIFVVAELQGKQHRPIT